MKKLLFLFILMLSPMWASADVVEIDGICYDLSAYNKTAEVTRNPNNYSGKVDIPATVVYNEVTYVVTSIGKEAFLDCGDLVSVTIPNSVIAILDHAFTGCRFLTAVTIPNSVEYINWGAFFECTSLTSIRLSNSITTIASNAFEKCRGLTSIIIPNSVTSIGAWSFKDCNSLTSIVIPNSVTHIGGGAFSNCSSLTTITIGSSVEIIDYNAFADCPKLTDVYCYVESVPVLAERVFYGTPIELSTLHVPATSIEAYRKVSPWDQFGEIVPLGKETAYRPFIEEGKVWTYHYYNDMTGKDFYESLMVSGDTVVDDKSYKKIVDVTTGRVDCAIREEGRKVYATYPHYSGEKLIYDFGLNVGDAFQLYDDNNGSDPNAWATVVSVDTIVVGSRAFRALDVRSNDMKGWPNWWVEGIGGEYGLTENCLLLGNSYCFSSCKLGEDTLFTNHDFQTLGTIPSIETQMAYYYYKGNKIPLTLNENKVVVSIPKEYDGVCKRIRANLPVLSTIKDGVFDSFIIPRSDFERLTSQDFWKEDAKSVVLTSSYYTEDKTEVFETPYLNVKLKKEEDADLLASYAEKYRLKIVGNDSFMPLWYILHVTPESEKSPLKCANEIFESGEFASAVPDLSSDDDFDLGIAYRPFIEDGKVWKVGTIPTVSGNPVQVVDYYYFAGDTIIGGKTCKQMMCQRYVSPGFSDAAPSLTKVGAWYEEDKKVYRYYARDKQFRLWYDFSADANDTLQIYEDHPPYIISPRKTGGIKGFKGIYRDVMMTYEGELLNYNISTWMEGVGNIAGPIYCVYIGEELYKDFLMSCTVGDEVIYLNDEYEDGATPEALARKDRIDFTHTIKIKPKSRTAREAEAKSLYGEYNSQQLGLNLNSLDEAYQVSITDEAGKTVYEKTVNAGSIVGLNIDISAYAKGRYTVTVENSNESFTGEIDTRTTGIEENVRIEEFKNGSIYNLQGQRINSLRKGLNIVDGRKMFVK